MPKDKLFTRSQVLSSGSFSGELRHAVKIYIWAHPFDESHESSDGWERRTIGTPVAVVYGRTEEEAEELAKYFITSPGKE